MSDRLNSGMRDEILSRIDEHTFGKRREKLETRRFRLADSCYRALYSKPVRKKMEALPEGWLPTEVYIRVAFGGRQNTLRFAEEENRRFQERHTHYDGILSLGADSPQATKFADIEADKATLHEESLEARAQVRAVLNRVTTLAKLKKEWPEVTQFTKGLGDSPFLPALPIRKLNETLGLKSESPRVAPGGGE